jgi:hypothetical protein
MRLLIFFLFQSKTDYAEEHSCLCESLGSGKMYVKALATVGKLVCLFSYCYGVFTATLMMFSFYMFIVHLVDCVKREMEREKS